MEKTVTKIPDGSFRRMGKMQILLLPGKPIPAAKIGPAGDQRCGQGELGITKSNDSKAA